MQLTVREAAKLLGAPEKQVYRWIDEGEIPCSRVNDQIRFNRAELLEWATARRIPISVAAFHATGVGSAVNPGLVQALWSGGIHYDVPGTDRESVLRAVVGLVQLPEALDPEFLIQVLLAREALGSTGVGDGIAIPHVRNPVVLNGAPAAITLCFLKSPVEFGAIDGLPVDTIFTMISPTIEGHLQLLARLSRALLDPKFRALIKTRASRDEILTDAGRVEATFPQSASSG